MTERLIFSQTFEGLFRAVRRVLDPPTASALRAAGIDPDQELRPAYPLPVFLDSVRLLARRLFPEAAEGEGIHLLARQFMDGYAATMVGRAVVGMMRVIGPRRTLERLTRQFRTANNFSETRLREVQPGQCELWCNQVTLPGWYEGLLERGLELSGAKNVRVALIQKDGEGATFRIEWG
jgi:uncharacterized protein (TIGR02265 family)